MGHSKPEKSGHVDWKGAGHGEVSRGGKQRTPNPLWAEETLSRAGWPQAGLDSATISGLWALVDFLGDILGFHVVAR